MHSLFDIVGFEYKKLFKRKGTVICLVIVTLWLIALPALILIGNVYINGEFFETKYEAMVKDKKYAMELSGEKIDETLLLKVKEAYLKVPLGEGYEITEEYEQYGRQYKDIFHMMYLNFGCADIESLSNLTLNEMQRFYEIRHERIKNSINESRISDSSKEKLIQIDNEINTPLIYGYSEGYNNLFMIIQLAGVVVAFAVAVSFSPIFAGEYSEGTSQLILSSKYGKNKAILAKLFVSVSFCIIYCFLLIISIYLVCGLIYGYDGANVSLQFYWFYNIYPLNMIQATIIFSVCILFASLFTCVITLFLSSKLKSSFTVIVIVSALIFVPMLLVNADWMQCSWIRLLPYNMMDFGWVFSSAPYEVFGLTILPYVFIPIFSLFMTVIMLPLAWRGFKNHQV